MSEYAVEKEWHATVLKQKQMKDAGFIDLTKSVRVIPRHKTQQKKQTSPVTYPLIMTIVSVIVLVGMCYM